jgi:hypothetical protein
MQVLDQHTRRVHNCSRRGYDRKRDSHMRNLLVPCSRQGAAGCQTRRWPGLAAIDAHPRSGADESDQNGDIHLLQTVALSWRVATCCTLVQRLAQGGRPMLRQCSSVEVKRLDSDQTSSFVPILLRRINDRCHSGRLRRCTARAPRPTAIDSCRDALSYGLHHYDVLRSSLLLSCRHRLRAHASHDCVAYDAYGIASASSRRGLDFIQKKGCVGLMYAESRQGQ